jgi:hypothetical protein
LCLVLSVSCPSNYGTVAHRTFFSDTPQKKRPLAIGDIYVGSYGQGSRMLIMAEAPRVRSDHVWGPVFELVRMNTSIGYIFINLYSSWISRWSRLRPHIYHCQLRTHC